MSLVNKCLFFVSNNIGGLASLLPVIKYYEMNKYNVFVKQIMIVEQIKINAI